MPNVTRGGLQPAKITNLANKKVVNCMFNPHEYTISKANAWKENWTLGQNHPYITFTETKAQTLSLTLHFDSLPERKDVRDFTAPLWAMTQVAEAKERNNQGAPPIVAFDWGSLHFEAVITKLSEKFSLFLEDGTPVRSQIDIDLLHVGADAFKQVQTQATISKAREKPTTLIKGDTRPDNVAVQITGSANNMRSVCNRNGQDNPLDSGRRGTMS